MGSESGTSSMLVYFKFQKVAPRIYSSAKVPIDDRDASDFSLANPLSGRFLQIRPHQAPAKISARFTGFSRFEYTCNFEIFAFCFCIWSDITV